MKYFFCFYELHITYILSQVIISYEEKEANERLPEDDSECFLATCDNIRAAMTKIVKLKSSGDPNVCNKTCRIMIIIYCCAFCTFNKTNVLGER